MLNGFAFQRPCHPKCCCTGHSGKVILEFAFELMHHYFKLYIRPAYMLQEGYGNCLLQVFMMRFPCFLQSRLFFFRDACHRKDQSWFTVEPEFPKTGLAHQEREIGRVCRGGQSHITEENPSRHLAVKLSMLKKCSQI